MIHITDKEVYTDDPAKLVHRKGTDAYFHRTTLLEGDTIDDFEEVDEIPATRPMSEDERKAAISALIHERYSLDDEIAILRQKDDSDSKRAEYEEYCTFAEMCKRQVDTSITN